MKLFSKFDLSDSAQTFAVANTPLFLLRKLRQDPVVLEIARSLSARELLAEFHESLHAAPKDLVEAVAPFVYASALSMKESDAYLLDASRNPAIDQRDWLRFFVETLFRTFSPTSRVDILVPAQLNAQNPLLSVKTSTHQTNISVKE